MSKKERKPRIDEDVDDISSLTSDKKKHLKAKPDTDDRNDEPLYWYDKARDVYSFTELKIALSGNMIRDIVNDYSWTNGKASSINDIARKNSLTRATVRKLLRALGKTHDSTPFTDETIADTPEGTLVEDLVRGKEQRVLVQAEKKRWEQIKKVAEEAENWDNFLFKRLASLPTPVIQAPKKAKIKVVSKSRFDSQTMVFMGLQDLHFGSYGWAFETGQSFDRETCRKRLLQTTEETLERVCLLGKPEVFLLGAGGDFFHIDNPENKTTKGTPQDVHGTFAQIMHEGFELMGDYINLIRTVAPVIVEPVPGNHDKNMSFALLKWLQTGFKNESDVEIHDSARQRAYRQFGNNLIGLTHGDGPKVDKLPGLMAGEARVMWGQTHHRYWFSGHFHTQMQYEIDGVQCFFVPSLSGTDRWSQQEGYTLNKKAMAAFVLDKEEGLIAQMPVGAKD